MFAQIYLVESKLRETVNLDKVFEVPRDDVLVRIPYNAETYDAEKRYFVERGEFLHRIFILQTAETEALLLGSIMKAGTGPRRTVRVPKRRSLGDLKISLTKFQDSQESNKSVLKAVNAVRTESVLSKIKDCKTIKKKEKNASQDQPPTNEVTESLEEGGTNESTQAKKELKKAKGVARDDKDSEARKKGKKPSKGEKETATILQKPNEEGKKIGSSKISGKGNAQNVTVSSKVVENHTDNNTSHLKENSSEAEQAGSSNVHEVPQKSTDADNAGSSNGLVVPESGDDKFNQFSTSLSMTSTPLKERRKMDYCNTCEILNQKVISLEAEISDLKSRLSKENERFNMIQIMNNNLQNLCSALSQESTDKIKKSNTSKACKIKMASNVTEEEGIEIEPTMIYIGKGHFVDKSGLAALETKKPRNFKTRIEGVVKLVWPAGNAKEYNLAGSDGKKPVEEYQVNAVYHLLNLLSWKNINLKPLKVNKKMVEPLTYEHIKRKLGIHLSELTQREEEHKEGKDKKKKNRKKVVESEDESGSEEEKEGKEVEKNSKGEGKDKKKKNRKKVVESEDESGSEEEKEGKEVEKNSKGKKREDCSSDSENDDAASNGSIVVIHGPAKKKKVDDSFDRVQVKEEPLDDLDGSLDISL